MGYLVRGPIDTSLFIVGLVKALPITIIVSLIGSWSLYFYKKEGIAKFLMIIPFINIILIMLLSILSRT